MRTGTKSLLFGVHQFVIHPVVVLLGWWRLYGFPRDPRVWVAILVHDWGYWGRTEMDGGEDGGHGHVELGAKICERLFGREWGELCRYHSRYLARRDGERPSRLCFADKISVLFMPSWLYLLLGNWSGEIEEYLGLMERRGKEGEPVPRHDGTKRGWLKAYKAYMREWVAEHVGGAEDTWTPKGD